MLDTPPQDQLHKHLYFFNACEHSWIMMIMIGSKMFKIEYDIKAIMYPAYDTTHKLCNVREIKLFNNPDYHPIMQADPCVSSNAPSFGPSGGLGHNLFDFVFLWMGKPAWGAHIPWRRDLAHYIIDCAHSIRNWIFIFIHSFIYVNATIPFEAAN